MPLSPSKVVKLSLRQTAAPWEWHARDASLTREVSLRIGGGGQPASWKKGGAGWWEKKGALWKNGWGPSGIQVLGWTQFVPEILQKGIGVLRKKICSKNEGGKLQNTILSPFPFPTVLALCAERFLSSLARAMLGSTGWRGGGNEIPGQMSWKWEPMLNTGGGPTSLRGVNLTAVVKFTPTIRMSNEPGWGGGVNMKLKRSQFVPPHIKGWVDGPRWWPKPTFMNKKTWIFQWLNGWERLAKIVLTRSSVYNERFPGNLSRFAFFFKDKTRVFLS